MVDYLEDFHDMVDHEKCGNLNVLNVLKMNLKISKHSMWWKRNLNCLLMKVMQFLKMSMIPLH